MNGYNVMSSFYKYIHDNDGMIDTIPRLKEATSKATKVYANIIFNRDVIKVRVAKKDLINECNEWILMEGRDIAHTDRTGFILSSQPWFNINTGILYLG